jgi:hypothetical protein
MAAINDGFDVGLISRWTVRGRSRLAPVARPLRGCGLDLPRPVRQIYVNTNKQVGDPEHLKVFANADAAETWFEENDPEGVAFEYEVLE